MPGTESRILIPAGPVTKVLTNHAGCQPPGERFVSGKTVLVLLRQQVHIEGKHKSSTNR